MWRNEYDINIKCDEMCQNLSSLHGVQTTKFRHVPRAMFRGPPLVGHFVKGQIRRRAGFEQRSGKEHPWTSLGCRFLRTGIPGTRERGWWWWLLLWLMLKNWLNIVLSQKWCVWAVRCPPGCLPLNGDPLAPDIQKKWRFPEWGIPIVDVLYGNILLKYGWLGGTPIHGNP